MCNCGNKRTQISTDENAAPQIRSNMQQTANTVFEYVGKTALTVIGNISGRRYRFNRPGDLQSVDPRDVAGMFAVTVLRQR